MKLIEAQQSILRLGELVVQTSDVAAALDITRASASKTLARLGQSGVATQLTRGHWLMNNQVEPLRIPEFLAAPSPSYISLQTALYYHGMISQIPEVIYAVTTSKTRKFNTALGSFSLHHLEPDFFFPPEGMGANDVKMASPEKALLDLFYLSPARSNLFTTLPEIFIPKGFSWTRAAEIAAKIKSPSRRTIVLTKLQDLRERQN
jgi:predicted transcriptional regulator of viral defense system